MLAHILTLLSLLLPLCSSSTGKHVCMKFSYENNKWIPLTCSANETVPSAEDGSDKGGISNSVVALIFLFLLFMVTFVASVVIIVTIANSYTLRR